MVKKKTRPPSGKAEARSAQKTGGKAARRDPEVVEEPADHLEAYLPESTIGGIGASAGGLDDMEIHREELQVRAHQLDEAQSALEAVEDLLADAPLGYVTLDAVGTIRVCNQTAGRMLGIEPASAPGWSFSAFAAPEDKKRLLDHLLKCGHGEEPVRTELTLKSLGDVNFPCQLVSRPAKTVGHGLFRTAILDLTDRRRVEEALQTTERRFSAAVEASGAGLFELEIPFEGRLYLSHRLADILGYARTQLPGPDGLPEWLELRVHNEDRERVREIYNDFSTGRREAYVGDVRFRHKNGSWHWLRIWAKATVAAAGSTTRDLVGVTMDVTLEKERAIETERRARQLRALAAELYHVEERERRELATELHDNLAQLIVATKMKLGVIDPSESAKGLRQQVEEALQLLDRADESIRSLTFSLSPPVLDELGLTSAVKWLAKDMEKQFGLRVELQEKGELVLVDPRIRFMLFRSIRELLINAAKHAHTTNARVVLESTDGGVRVVVEDEGQGFEVARAEGSRGFGLFSIQERIESIGGNMMVRTEPGHGTSVTLLLAAPGERLDAGHVKVDPAAASHTRAPQPSEGRERIRVLLADDHELVRSALARLLDAQSDLQVIGEASDGESAVEMVSVLTPDVVLMDVTMSGVGGIEATRRISAEHPGARIIGLSMHESADIASAMRKAGAFEYLRKSSPTHVLIDTIRRAASHARNVASPPNAT